MELKDFIKFLKKDRINILLWGLSFMASGIFLYYFVPKQYNATGSFLILRTVAETNPNDFSYEGYYASQNSSTYTQSFSALLQSYDLRNKSLEDLGVKVTADSLRDAGRNIKIKKMSPQLVSLTVSSTSRDFAVGLWTTLSNNAIEVSKTLNTESGDPNLNIKKVSFNPVVYEGFRNVYVNAVLGFFLGSLIGIFISALKKHLA